MSRTTVNNLGQTLKRDGNLLFNEGLISQAIDKYSEAIIILEKQKDPQPSATITDSDLSRSMTDNDELLSSIYSNRSLCYLKLAATSNDESIMNNLAKEDGLSSVKLTPMWVRSYQRLGDAYVALDDKENAILTYKRGLKVDPNDEKLLTVMNAIEKEVAASASQAIREAKMESTIAKLRRENPELFQKPSTEPLLKELMHRILSNPIGDNISRVLKESETDQDVNKLLKKLMGL